MESTSFKRTRIEVPTAVSSGSALEASESRYWRTQVKLCFAHKFAGACTACAFAPSETRSAEGFPVLRLACASSLSVTVFGVATGERFRQGGSLARKPSTKTLGKFGAACDGASWRGDGRLIAAGDGFGGVHVLDATTGAELRTMGRASPKDLRKIGAERRAARSTAWGLDASLLASGGDDGARVWDVATGERVGAMRGEVRSVAAYGEHTWLVGGAEGVVALWDCRAAAASARLFEHGPRVEAIACSGDLLASAGGRDVVLWDVPTGRRVHAFRDAHAKAGACAAFASGGRRLLSGGHDGVVKAHSLSAFESVRVGRFDAPVLSVAVGRDDLALAVGTATGVLEARLRLATAKHHRSRKQSLAPPPGTYRHFQRGKGFELPKGAHADVVVATPRTKKPRLMPHDEALRKFDYGGALDAALDARDPAVVVAVLGDLDRRGGLRAALGKRDEDRLEPLLSFLAAHVATPRYADRLVRVAAVAIHLYEPAIGTIPAVDDLFAKIRAAARAEVDTQRSLLHLSGAARALAARVGQQS
ncbi:hypothetical protein CTAYLR_002369 [Chrysophaeum taylorii]|uniref:U3 small nucleolar RNA-associated protein 15 C-terminal domain-containing protein n=1 Tax=Chrysophaeum taylorii TaxID=2483200 RepID=A0AAD7UHU6_9STRA|nr:hypothetical protein CTAYLR_002369 [Chrysophaeum taylorii]